MKNFNRIVVVVAVSFFSALSQDVSEAADQSSALETYLRAYGDMAKVSAIKTNAIIAAAEAQAKLINAQAAMITAAANARATDAKTLETFQQVKSLSLDNSLKTAKTFYDKRALYKAYKDVNPKKRPTCEDISRYAKTSVPEGLSRSQIRQVGQTRSEINWPLVLQREEFFYQRTNFASVLDSRLSASKEEARQEAKRIASSMRENLRSVIREISPSEYVEARKFIDGLEQEAQNPLRIGGVVSN